MFSRIRTEYEPEKLQILALFTERKMARRKIYKFNLLENSFEEVDYLPSKILQQKCSKYFQNISFNYHLIIIYITF